jgi:hypothetical protein
MAVSIERRLAEKATAANEATRLCTRSSIQMRAFAIARTKGIPAAFQACLCLVSPVGRRSGWLARAPFKCSRPDGAPSAPTNPNTPE